MEASVVLAMRIRRVMFIPMVQLSAQRPHRVQRPKSESTHFSTVRLSKTPSARDFSFNAPSTVTSSLNTDLTSFSL
jgi:hypothetical protein